MKKLMSDIMYDIVTGTKIQALTLIEIYSAIVSSDNSKSAIPGFFQACSLRTGKHAVVTSLEIIFDCIKNCIFTSILKHEYDTPIHKKSQTRRWAAKNQFLYTNVSSTFRE